jgi:hypothetical protein
VAADEGIFLGETFSESILAPLCRKVVLFAPKICRGAVVMLGFVSADQETGIFYFWGLNFVSNCVHQILKTFLFIFLTQP